MPTCKPTVLCNSCVDAAGLSNGGQALFGPAASCQGGETSCAYSCDRPGALALRSERAAKGVNWAFGGEPGSRCAGCGHPACHPHRSVPLLHCKLQPGERRHGWQSNGFLQVCSQQSARAQGDAGSQGHVKHVQRAPATPKG